MVYCSSMVHQTQDLAGLKFASMANGAPSVITSGTTVMPVLYAENLDSHLMVYEPKVSL